MTLHDLYRIHGHAFDLPAQARAMSTPDRGMSEYAAFCILWPKVQKLLNAPALLQEYPGGCTFYSPPLPFDTLHEALADMRIRIHAPNQRRVRVLLLDDTVIREWGAP